MYNSRESHNFNVDALSEEIVLASRQNRYANALYFKKFIESLLKTAFAEAMEGARKKGREGCEFTHSIFSKNEIKAEAFEEAAKIAEKLSEPWQGGDISPLEQGMGRIIAKHIRQRAKELRGYDENTFCINS